MSETTFIYVLKCPTTGAIRYVGKTDNAVNRLRTHLATKSRCHRSYWVQSLLKQGLKPILEVIDEVPMAEWQAWEAAYIQFFFEEGHDRTNGTFGGDAPAMTEESRRKNSESKQGPKNPMFGKSSWNKGLHISNPAQREKMKGNCFVGKGVEHHNFGKPAWNRGLKASAKAVENQRKAHLGQKISSESIKQRTETRRKNGWNRRDR